MYPFSGNEGSKTRAGRKRKRSGDCFEDDDDGARVLDESSPSPKSSLWEVIVKWDDVSFKHVLPRLHSNDLKFLHGVNSETRKLIKRSSRAGDLEKRFKLKQMSSISTLEVAWENRSLWAWRWDERSFCYKVAYTNKLELLKWAREEKKCEWNAGTINMAARRGNLEMVKYCVANRCTVTADACANAAKNGHLECLKYLHEEVQAPLNSPHRPGRTASWAAKSGHLHILEYLVERKFDKYNTVRPSLNACAHAAKNGHLDCLKYLHETAKAPWDEDAVREAHKNNQTECVQYLLDNNCPLPWDWRYERGELRVPE